MKLLSDSMMDRVSVEDIGGKPMTKSVNEKERVIHVKCHTTINSNKVTFGSWTEKRMGW